MKKFKAVRQKGVSALAWASFGMAIVGGALAADMWIGKTIRTILKAIPWEWLPPVVLAAAVIAVAIDLFIDGVPNQVALGGALLAPAVATATPGKLGEKVAEGCGWLLAQISAPLEDWLGTGSATGLAVGAIVATYFMGRRVVKKAKGSKTTAEV